MNIYQQQILDHYHNPRSFGAPENYTHSFAAENLTCGDEVTFFLDVDSESRLIRSAHFTGSGCAISIASASLLTEELAGKNQSDVEKMGKESMLELLGITLTSSRLKCALLPLEAAKSALTQ
jgi:nitrogen fixation NifU-like protein